VWGTSQGDLYIIGTNGILLRATVGATTAAAFKQETLPASFGTTYSFWGIWGSDQTGYVYVVGDNGLILHKAVGGMWQVERAPAMGNTTLYAVYGAKNGNDVWTVGDSGTVLRGQ
jgi:hypothetical protein